MSKKRWSYNRRVQVAIDDIIVPRERITSVLDPAIKEELEDSIAAGGIKRPVDLMHIGEDLYLIDGLHRIEVAERLGLKKVPAVITKGTIDDLLIKNIIFSRQRGKSNPAQEAEVLALLQRKRGMPLETAAKTLGMSLGWARKLIRIADLPDEIKEGVKHGKIPVMGAFYITHIDNPTTQAGVARDAIHFGYTVEQVKAAVTKALNPDYEPLPGEFEVIPGQAPKRVPIPCGWCGRPMDPKRAPYVWTCPYCQPLIEQFIKAYITQYGPPGRPQQQLSTNRTPTEPDQTLPP